jgi:hypothetical protein
MGRSSFVFPAKRIACFKIRYKIAVQYIARKIPFMFFFSGNCAASVPISTFMCLGEMYMYIPRIGSHISLQQNRQTDPGNI